LENLVVDRQFWRNKRVLITGHTGFKGSWLSLWLQNMGADVHGFSLSPPTDPSLFERAEISRGMNSTIADIRNFEAVAKVFSDADPQIVFHLAAQPLVRLSYDDPITTYSTNVMGTVNLLEVIRQAALSKGSSVQAVVVVTSDKCYENKEWQWGYRENDRLGGHDPYSNSKGCTEMVVQSFRQSYFGIDDSNIALASARAGNVIGGGDWATDRLVPDAISAFQNGRELMIRSPGAVRPWQHVLEPLAGYMLLARQLFENTHAYTGAWNFGPAAESEKPVSYVVDAMARLWQGDARWTSDSDINPHEASILKLDSSLSRGRLGWQPRLMLEHALAFTTDWYQANNELSSMREYSIEQIANYEKSDHVEQQEK
jgi:CDP-glucose 4,6-dehydratase